MACLLSNPSHGASRLLLEICHLILGSSRVHVCSVGTNAKVSPSLCRSEVDDINLGLQHYYETFNVVHARLICTGVSQKNSFTFTRNVFRTSITITSLPPTF